MGSKNISSFSDLAKEHALYPKESLLMVNQGDKILNIGLPREIESMENRICLTPDAVRVLVANGNEVTIETRAGHASKYADKEYSEAGAKIAYSPDEVFKCDIVLKVNPPTLEEVKLMKVGGTLMSALQVAKLKKEYLEEIIKKRITAISFEFIEDKVGGRPVVRAMSEIAGNTVMLIAAEYLNSVNCGKGIILGGITGVPPTQVVILGAGTVAENAARSAIGLGAEVKVFDNRIYKLTRLKQNVSSSIYTSTINSETLKRALKEADVVIGALRSEDGRTPCVVTEEMVMGMQEDSIIIDVSIDRGGCFETSEITSHANPIYKKGGVIHYCVPNIASRVARTASTAFSNIFTPTLLHVSHFGGIEKMIFSKEWLMKGVYAYNGCLTSPLLSKLYNLKYKDMKLLIAASLKSGQ